MRPAVSRLRWSRCRPMGRASGKRGGGSCTEAVSPVARIVQGELRAKLDEPVLSLDFTALYAADVSGRARAVPILGRQATRRSPKTKRAGSPD